jgi:phosphotransferase system enzyme I (PtsI)
MELTDLFPRRQLRGLGVSPGSARGPVVRMGDPVPLPDDAPSALTAAQELALAHSAMHSVATDLRTRASLAHDVAGDVLRAQALMAEDPVMADDVARRLERGGTAARAIWEAFGVFRDTMLRGDTASRVADLDDVRNRLIAACLGVALPSIPAPGYPFVLTAHSLSPADTAVLRRDHVLAIVTVDGGPTSHTAIMARALGIPAIVGCDDVMSLPDGVDVMVDGGLGMVEITTAAADGAVAVPSVSAPLPGRTASSAPVALLANIGRPEELPLAVAAGAEGVGLLRTEFLYLRASTAPSILEQENALRSVFSMFTGQVVVVRMLDAGGDKPLPFLSASAEPNPALGVRGLRALRAYPRILDDQLTALARAAKSCRARVAVMAPMVTDARDASWFSQRVRSFAGLPSSVEIGMMVETPAAALTAESIVAQSDFVSIGTNDLTQYVLAADRSVAALSELQDPWHPAVLELVARVTEAGRRAGKPVSVCGEAAADPLLALVFVGLGVSSLSMTWSAIPVVRSHLSRFSLSQCSALAAAALSAHDGAEAKSRVANTVG